MWIVRLALRRPYTFVVLAVVVLLLTPVALQRTPTDIFPNIAIPVVSTVWNYGGLSAPEMANRIVSGYERALTTTVNDIEHIESQSLAGVAVVKVFFQPRARIDAAVSQVTAIAQTVVRQMPPCSSSRSRARASRSNSSSTSATTRSARSSRPWKARRFRIRTAASSGRSRSTSTSPRFKPRGSLTAHMRNEWGKLTKHYSAPALLPYTSLSC